MNDLLLDGTSQLGVCFRQPGALALEVLQHGLEDGGVREDENCTVLLGGRDLAVDQLVQPRVWNFVDERSVSSHYGTGDVELHVR